MRELASGVYNMLKGTRQHAIPVGEFIDRLSKNEEEIEANLSTVFQNMRGSLTSTGTYVVAKFSAW